MESNPIIKVYNYLTLNNMLTIPKDLDMEIILKTKCVPETYSFIECNDFNFLTMELCGDNGYVNFLFLNFGANETYQFVNYRWLANTKELYIKLYQPLPDDVKEQAMYCGMAESMSIVNCLMTISRFHRNMDHDN